MSEPLRIVFFGTPTYAVPTLSALAGDARFQVELVVTQPDRPAGRGRKLNEPPVKTAAASRGISIYQPASLRSAAARQPLASVEADLFVVAAYGLIFGPKTLAMPRIACVNLHASLLPAYRGASPISAAILSGDVITGVTLMEMDAGLDTGTIIAVATCPVEARETTASLTDKLAGIGAGLALDALPKLVRGELTPTPQPNDGASLVRPLQKSDGQLDWNRHAVDLERLVRAMWPWPRGWFTLAGEAVQVHSSSLAEQGEGGPGTVSLRNGGLIVTTGEGGLRLDLLQFPGGKPMTGALAAASGRIVPGAVLPAPLTEVNVVPMVRAVE